MKLSTFSAIFAATGAAAQSLTDVLNANNSTLSALNGLLAAQPGLVSSLAQARNITILAPNNQAIAALTSDPATVAAIGADPGLISAVLTYHVINGTFRGADFSSTPRFLPTLLSNETYAQVSGGQRVEASTAGQTVVFKSGLERTSNVTQADITFDGGVIHVINSVLTVPPNATATLGQFSLTGLAQALTTADLVRTVSSLKDVTIFAPSNSAFANIASTAANLTTKQLSDVLTYHVVQGTVAYSTSLRDGQKVKTVNGQEITIGVKDGAVTVNNAKVITPNVLISNGVVHVIDSVLLPNASSTTPGTANPSGTTTSPPASEGHQLLRTGTAAFAVVLSGIAMAFAL